jgi:hypothetical protein
MRRACFHNVFMSLPAKTAGGVPGNELIDICSLHPARVLDNGLGGRMRSAVRLISTTAV